MLSFSSTNIVLSTIWFSKKVYNIASMCSSAASLACGACKQMIAEQSLLQSVLVTAWNCKYITQISLLSLFCSVDE
jgi:hypothetical protein